LLSSLTTDYRFLSEHESHRYTRIFCKTTERTEQKKTRAEPQRTQREGRTRDLSKTHWPTGSNFTNIHESFDFWP